MKIYNYKIKYNLYKITLKQKLNKINKINLEILKNLFIVMKQVNNRSFKFI